MAEIFNKLSNQLSTYLRQEDTFVVRTLVKLEDLTGVQREHQLYGLLAVFSIYFVFGNAAELLCNIVGVLYPAYASFKAIESHDKSDDTQWLTYWTVFAFVIIVDFCADKIMSYFPFYWLLKCLLLLWLYLPMFRGAEQLYERFLGPTFRRLFVTVKEIEEEVEKANSKTKESNSSNNEKKKHEE